MSQVPSPRRLELPEGLRRQLGDFRRRVWTIKSVEALASAAFGVVAAFLVMFGLDRAWDTPGWPRVALFGFAALMCALVPMALYRWVWRQRRDDQLARLLARKHPRIGDQLLGAIELAHDDSEQHRSRRLVEAAIEQVAHDSSRRNFADAVPSPRHRLWVGLALAVGIAAVGLALAYPRASSNAWARLLNPWNDTPRYTFAALEPVPARVIVAHGEPFPFAVKLAGGTERRPAQATARVGDRAPVVAKLVENGYTFELPSQVNKARVVIEVGDANRTVEVEPMLRPELSAVVAEVTLPDYLGRPGSKSKDVRGGSIALVKGAKVQFTATAGRELASAWVDNDPRVPVGAAVMSQSLTVDGPRDLQFRWSDRFGLAGKEPFTLKLAGRDDEAPTLVVEDLPRQKVVLDSELLQFKVRAQDDFGVRKVGIEWQGLDPRVVRSTAAGERALAGGAPDKETLEVAGTFSAKTYGIEPQPIALRVYVEDYLPGRPRVVSAPYTLFVLSAEQHAIWLTEQLSRWHRQSLEVRDREMALYETNKQLRELSPQDLDRPETRKKIEAQAQAERANGRRLNGLVLNGEDLVKQAMRNPEFAIGHLERWAEMLQVLKDISANRMPSVADLLKQAAQAEKAVAQNTPPSTNNAPMAGQVRPGGNPKPGETPPPGPAKPPTQVPTLVDRESSQMTPDKDEGKPMPASPPKTPRLTLPTTTLAGGVKPGDPPPAAPAAQKVEEALKQQLDLLAEFEKVADEMNKILANLEGSTLVKRLKAASRLQTTIAGKISDQVGDAFGIATAKPVGKAATALADMAGQEAKGSLAVSYIMDDIAAYFDRRRYARFKTVLDEMKEKDVIGALRTLGEDLKKEQGLSIAQCEFWSDTLDRWAEDLVDPGKSGVCNAKSKSSLPPAIVLEVLQILEGEVNLREETRVTDQSRSAIKPEDLRHQADGLSHQQKDLRERVVKVLERIVDLPDGEAEFAYEIDLLGQVVEVMEDAANILAKPEVGAPAVAAETDAIELLLQSKRINPKGGGGGGSSPGGGGRGTTTDSALALIGTGVNQKEVREDRAISQATGDNGPALPEEFRNGLDQYFNKLERPPGGQ